MTWVRIPDTWFRDAAELSPGSRDLFVRLLSYSALTRSDGYLTRSAVAAATDEIDVTRLLAELVKHGFLEDDDRGWTIVNAEDYLYTEAKRKQKADAARLGGLARAERYRPTRGPDGKITGAVPDGKADTLPDGMAATLPVPSRIGIGIGTRPATGSTYEDTRGWDESWAPLLAAWQARGFRLPPSDRQRELLWPIVDSRPTDAAAWVQGAKHGSSSHDVVGHVLRQWHPIQDSVA
jgi:hypothetical protein